MKKILVIGGSLQSANRGINALTRGLLNGIYDAFKGEELHIKLLSFVINEKCAAEFVKSGKSYFIEEIPSSVRENIKILLKPGCTKGALCKIYSEADLILDLSAGDSFTDIYGIKRYIYTTLPKLVSLKMHKKFVLLPQTIGPFRRRLTRAVSKYIVNNCGMNFARDKTSYDYMLNNLKTDRQRAVLTSDLAFNMRPAEGSLINDIIDPDSMNRAPLAGINISALLYHGGYRSKNLFSLSVNYYDLIKKIIGYFIDRRCNILLVPHVICPGEDVEDDYSLCRKTMEEIRQYYPHIYTFEKRYREDQIKAIIGRCDFFVGSRMHACIGAISMGVPTVPVAYSRKFTGVWERFGLADCVADARNMTADEIIAIIDRSYRDKQAIRNKLEAELESVKKDLNEMFKMLSGF